VIGVMGSDDEQSVMVWLVKESSHNITCENTINVKETREKSNNIPFQNVIK